MRPKSLLYPALFALCPLLALPRPARAQAVYTITYSLGSATATQGGSTLTITGATGTATCDAQGNPALPDHDIFWGLATAVQPPFGSIRAARPVSFTVTGPGIPSAGYTGGGLETVTAFASPASVTGGGSYYLGGTIAARLVVDQATSAFPVTDWSPSARIVLFLQAAPPPAPEPAAWALWGVGAAGLLCLTRRRRGMERQEVFGGLPRATEGRAFPGD